MINGTVKWFNTEKGFGFIALEDGRDIFVHATAVKAAGMQELQQGQRLTLEVGQGRNGKTEAVDLRAE